MGKPLIFEKAIQQKKIFSEHFPIMLGMKLINKQAKENKNNAINN